MQITDEMRAKAIVRTIRDAETRLHLAHGDSLGLDIDVNIDRILQAAMHRPLDPHRYA
jgi:hypothetical protein